MLNTCLYIALHRSNLAVIVPSVLKREGRFPRSVQLLSKYAGICSLGLLEVIITFFVYVKTRLGKEKNLAVNEFF